MTSDRLNEPLEDKGREDLEPKNPRLPMIPLRGLAVFPGVNLTFDVARDKSREAVKAAMKTDQMIFLTAQTDASQDWPEVDDVYPVGCVAKIRQVVELPGSDAMKLLVEGRHRARIVSVEQEDPCYTVEVKIMEQAQQDFGNPINEAYRRQLLKAFERFAAASSKIPPETLIAIAAIKDPAQTADAIAGQLHVDVEHKQALLEAVDTIDRTSSLIELLAREQQIAELEKEISGKVRSTIDKSQKEYFLREQIKAIQTELGEGENALEEQDIYLNLLEKTPIPEDAKEKVAKDIRRLARMPAGYPEGGVLRNYLDLLFEMPWGKNDPERLNIVRARKILNRDHYGLDKVKERILEYLAVRKLRIEGGETGSKGPILCLVGPPGVGKTSIAKSVSEALGRKYVRMSLGGIRDEAEIRGHRRTYVGAMPGRIINAIRQAGRDNPLILLDEIDKLGSDFRGDPSSALLEVLDPEQNNNFRDHYMEIPMTCPRFCSLQPPIPWRPSLGRYLTGWKWWSCPATRKKRRSKSPAAICSSTSSRLMH